MRYPVQLQKDIDPAVTGAPEPPPACSARQEKQEWWGVLGPSGDEAHTRASFEAGASDYLTKPFTIPELMMRVTTLFARVGWRALPAYTPAPAVFS